MDALNKKFIDLLIKNRMLSPIYEKEIEFLSSSFNISKPHINIFVVLFVFMSDGDLGIPLNERELNQKLIEKCEYAKKSMDEKNANVLQDIEEIKNIGNSSIKEINSLNELKYKDLFSKYGLFVIDNGYLYSRKNNYSRTNIINYIDELYKYNNNDILKFDYKKYKSDKIDLNPEFCDVIEKGINKNLLITGGPGTGKTTSVLFLLWALLLNDINYNIYITAPSAKAASRIKESINKNINNSLDASYRDKLENQEIKNKIMNLDGHTIHTLLGYDYKINGFRYNKNNQFPEKSIFVIDEASMIDADLFKSLLSAIKTGSRVFILGDKDQLPSVECGAVFGDLIERFEPRGNVVRLVKSNRFKDSSLVATLAKKINEGLPLENIEWKNYNEFKLNLNNCDINKEEQYPVYYYEDFSIDEDGKAIKEKDLFESVIKKWANYFYIHNEIPQELLINKQDEYIIGKDKKNNDVKRLDKSLESSCNDVEFNLSNINEINSKIDRARILCGENDSVRGVNEINKFIHKYLYKDSKTLSFNDIHPGEIIMINKNNYLLNLWNGDTGITVKFKNSNTLYLMIEKNSKLVDESFDLIEDKIFKYDKYMFYPLRMITSDEYNLAYAISIHKSQGSDYINILTILPKKSGHPLLNRQIVYTAITRTKSTTYILSNQKNLEEARDRILTRITNIK